MFSISTKCIALGLVVFLVVQGGHPLWAESSGPMRLDKGTKIALDLETPINSATTREGDAVLFRARNDIKAQGIVAIPRGTPIRGTVTLVNPAFVNAKPRHAEVRIRLDGIPLNDGQELAVQAKTLVLKAESAGQSVSTTVLQGSVGPAMTGGLVGGVIGGTARASRIGAVLAIGISAIDTARPPRVRGSDVDLPVHGIFETRLEHPLEIRDKALFAAAPATVVATLLAMDPNIAPAKVSSVPDHFKLTDQPRTDSSPAAPSMRVEDSAPNPAPFESSGVFTMSLDVNRVLIDAVVQDRAGRPLTSLQKSDFRLFEDGVEQPILDFSHDVLPLAVALVIDRSGSVAPSMNRIQTAAYQALQQLKPEDQVCLISFASDVQILEELTADRSRVASRISSIRAGGGTAILDAVGESLRYLERTAPLRRRAVILISDNVEGHSYTTLNETVQLASETEAVVYSVKIGQLPPAFPFGVPLPGVPVLIPQVSAPNFDPVQRITKETGGEIFTTNVNALDAALATAIARLKLRYTLSYSPLQSSTSSGRNYHGVAVRLVDRFGKSGSDYTVHSRSGYFGGPNRNPVKAGF